MSPGATPALPPKLGSGYSSEEAMARQRHRRRRRVHREDRAPCSCPCCRLRLTVRPGRCRCLRAGVRSTVRFAFHVAPLGFDRHVRMGLVRYAFAGVDLERHRCDVARCDAGRSAEAGRRVIGQGGDGRSATPPGPFVLTVKIDGGSCPCCRLRLTVRPARCRCLRSGLRRLRLAFHVLRSP